MALFCEPGRNPEVKEELQRRCRNGSRSPRNSLRRKVGIGSNSHDLDGDILMTFSNISMEHGCRLEKFCGILLINGCCAPEVSERTFSTFASRNRGNPPGANEGEESDDFPSRPSMLTTQHDMLRHSFFGFPELLEILSSQNWRSFSLNWWRMCRRYRVTRCDRQAHELFDISVRVG